VAVAFDADLGSTDGAGGAPLARTLVTGAPAAAGSRIILLVSWFGTQTLNTVSDGSAYAQDKLVPNGSERFAIWSRAAPAGLASGSTLTLTWSASPSGAVLIAAMSFTGVSGVDGVNGSATGSGSSWSSGSAAPTVPGALLVGGAGTEDPTAGTSSTPVNGAEVHDRYRAADGQGIVSGYVIQTSIVTEAITGTWSNAGATANTGGLAIYTPTAGAADATNTPTFQAIPFFLGGAH
jgi:hypothetical protein